MTDNELIHLNSLELALAYHQNREGSNLNVVETAQVFYEFLAGLTEWE